MRLVLSTAYTNLNAWINHASRVLGDAHAGDNHGHQFYGKFIYTATRNDFTLKITLKATEMCKINYICYYFEEHTVHLVQFLIQTNKCTTHPHKGNNNIGITPKIQSILYIQPPNLQLPCTVITTAGTAHSIL